MALVWHMKGEDASQAKNDQGKKGNGAALYRHVETEKTGSQMEPGSILIE